MEGPHEGLINRLARGLAPNAVSSQIPNHVRPWNETRSSLQRANDFYNQHCGGPPPHPKIDEYLAKDFPTQAEWEDLHGRPMPEYSDEYPPPLTQRIWNALPSAEQVCVGTFTGGGTLIGGAGGFVLGGGGGAAGGTLVAPGVGTVGGAAVGAYQGAALGGAGGAAVGYGLGDWLCR
ncbi:hypothetical protein [Yoonia sp. 2307UL14-13]|uniref:hypothetical protein n=1 Tax=Yoonia sp. 2307UL14-13 TaxID=3126506 RepID=UPI0030B6FE65